MTLLPLLLALGSPQAHAEAPCAAPATRADLQDTLQRAESAFSALDVETFTRSMDDAIFLVPCLTEVVEAPSIARLHRLQGIRQFVANQEDRAVEAFAAARATDAAYQLPVWLVPEGSAIRDLYGRMPLENGTSETVPAPVAGALRFDGVVSQDRPGSWSSFLQILDGTGKVVATAYLFPGDALPAYTAQEPVAVATAPSGGTRRPSRKVGLALASVSAGAVLGAGALYGLASASAADFSEDHPEWDESDLLLSRSRTNNLVIASGALGAVAAATGLCAALIVEW